MKNTNLLLRVFFVLCAIGILGFLWQQHQNTTIEIKSSGGSFSEGIIGTPRFINPVLAQSQADLDITRLVYTPILSIDRNGEVFYKLADSLETSDDKKTYTLTLRDDIYFSDDEMLDADDVVFTVKSIQDSLIKSPHAVKWQGVSVEKTGAATVTFTLTRAFSDFIYNLELGVLPEHIWDNVQAEEFIFSSLNTNPIGYGPYKVTDVERGDNGVPEKYSLKENEKSLEAPYIHHIDISFFANEEALVEALDSKSIDAAYGISPESLNDIDDSLTVHSATLPRVFGLFFNQQKQPVLSSKNIRKAIDLGINKDAITEGIFQSYAVAIHSVTGASYADSSYDPAAARTLIESEGWRRNTEGIYQKNINTTSTTLGFSIAIPNIDEMTKVAEMIKNDLSRIGIDVTIRSYDQGNLNQNIIRPREYEALLFGYEIEKPSDLYAFWHSSQISDPGLNISRYQNKTVDADLEALRSSENPSLEKINNAITNDYPAVFLYSPSYIYVLPEHIKGAGFSITESSDRFSTIEEWYIRTRHLWPWLINKNN